MTITEHRIEPVPAPDGHTLALALALAHLERHSWRPMLARLRASGVPLNAADDKDDDDTGDDDKDDSDKDDDDKDDDDKRSDLERAQAAAAAANRELRKIKAEREDAAAAAKKEAGKFKELYEEELAKREKLEAEHTTAAKERLVEAALTKAKAKNPVRAARLLDLDDIDDDRDAERAVKALLKEEPYLFNEDATRQKRGAGTRRDDSNNDDDDDDNGGSANGKKPRVSRLRQGLKDEVGAAKT